MSETIPLHSFAIDPDQNQILSQVFATGHPVCIKNLQGDVLFSNAGYEEFFVHSDYNTEEFFEAVLARLKEEPKISFEHSIRKDGKIFHFRSTYLSVHDAHDKMVAVCAVYQDVTAEKLLTQELMLNQDRMDDLVRLLAGWIWETDKNLHMSMVSPRIIDVLGRHPKELTGKKLISIGTFLKNDAKTPENDFAIIENRRPLQNNLLMMKSRSGDQHYFRLNAVPAFSPDTGEFLGYRGIANDVTAEIIAAQRADVSEGRLMEAINSISEGFTLFDKDDRIVLSNKKSSEFFPSLQNKIQQSASFDDLCRAALQAGDIALNHVQEDDWIKDRMEKRKDPGQPMEIKLRDGKWLMVNDHRTAHGETVTIQSDITELKKREEVLLAAKQIAEESSHTKSEFLAKVSHELRTPLNAIIGFSDVLKAEQLGPLGNPEYKEYLTDISESANHLLTVINDILDVSKVEAGKMELQEQKFDLAAAIHSAVRMVREQAMRRSQILEYPENANPLVLFGDQKKIKQILINLLSNASKFTPEGGSIKVGMEISADGHPQFWVKDTGIGIKKEDIPKALSAFGQIDSSLSRQFEGTGLGLPLCQALAEMHGGKLEIDSEPGQGTQIVITLPAERLIQD